MTPHQLRQQLRQLRNHRIDTALVVAAIGLAVIMLVCFGYGFAILLGNPPR